MAMPPSIAAPELLYTAVPAALETMTGPVWVVGRITVLLRLVIVMMWLASVVPLLLVRSY